MCLVGSSIRKEGRVKVMMRGSLGGTGKRTWQVRFYYNFLFLFLFIYIYISNKLQISLFFCVYLQDILQLFVKLFT